MIHLYKDSVRGDTVKWEFIITYDGGPYTILDSDVITACAKRRVSDDDSAAVVASSDIGIVVADQLASPGVITLTIASDITDALDPGNYYVDVQIKRTDQDPDEVVTPIRVMWKFDADVLRAR